MPTVLKTSSITANETSVLNKLVLSDASHTIVIQNSDAANAAAVQANINITDIANSTLFGLNIDNQVVDLKNASTNGSIKLSSGLKSLTIDEATDQTTVNTSLQSKDLKLTGSTSGTITVTPGPITTDHSLLLPSVQGTAGTFLKNDGSGALSWGSAQSSWTQFGSTISSGFTTNNTFADIDISSFASGSDEEMMVIVETNLHASIFIIYKSLLGGMDFATSGVKYEIAKYYDRFVMYQIYNSGTYLEIECVNVTHNKIKLYTR
jgi:hypothetical protein